MGGRVVGVVGVAPSTPNFILLLVILIYTSPPNFIKIGPKLTKFAIGVVFGVVGRVVGVVRKLAQPHHRLILCV